MSRENTTPFIELIKGIGAYILPNPARDYAKKLNDSSKSRTTGQRKEQDIIEGFKCEDGNVYLYIGSGKAARLQINDQGAPEFVQSSICGFIHRSNDIFEATASVHMGYSQGKDFKIVKDPKDLKKNKELKILYSPEKNKTPHSFQALLVPQTGWNPIEKFYVSGEKSSTRVGGMITDIYTSKEKLIEALETQCNKTGLDIEAKAKLIQDLVKIKPGIRASANARA